MARTVKKTFTHEQDTSRRTGHTSEQDRLRMLRLFDDLLAGIPLLPSETADTEFADLRRARQSGGRRTPTTRKM